MEKAGLTAGARQGILLKVEPFLSSTAKVWPRGNPMGFLKHILGFGSKPMYRRWILVSDNPQRMAYEKSVWNEIRLAVEPALGLTEHPSRLVAEVLDESLDRINKKKTVPPGDVSWCLEEGSPEMAAVHFASIRLQCPSFSVCEKKGLDPILYLELTRRVENKYLRAAHLAMCLDVDWPDECKEIPARLGDALDAYWGATTESAWTHLPESGSIDAFLTVGFNYLGGDRDRIPDIEKMEGDWEVRPTT